MRQRKNKKQDFQELYQELQEGARLLGNMLAGKKLYEQDMKINKEKEQ